MEGRPPRDDDPFEWTDAPPRSGRRYSERSFDTDEDPYETGERETGGRRRRRDTEERETFDPGETGAHPEDPYEAWHTGAPAPQTPEETGEPDPFDTTGEREYDTGEPDPFDTTGEPAYGTDERTDERERERIARRERRRARTGTGEHRTGQHDTGRHRRHRDLPARVRRRQTFGAAAVVGVLVIGGIVLATGGGGGGGEAGLPLKKLAGQTIVAPMSKAGPDKKLLRAARQGRIGGVIITTAQSPQKVKGDVARIQKAATSGDNPELLVMIDQEGGFVKELPGPPDTSPNDLGKAGDPNAAQAEGQKTADYLKPLGVNVNLAPVLDVTTPKTDTTIKTRTYGNDPNKVGEIGAAFIKGQQGAGVAATAKHFPGLGLSELNTDFGRADITASEAEVNTAIVPFQSAVDAGVELVMVSSGIYRGLNTANPAAFAPAIVQGQLRDKLGFQGAIITDDLDARGISDIALPGEAAVNSIKAGNDLLLFAQQEKSATQALSAVVRGINKGQVEASVVQAAYDNVLDLKNSLNQ